MKSFVDIGLLLNKNMLLRKNLQKSNQAYKEQAEIIKKRFTDESVIFQKLKSFVADKRIDFTKLSDHISEMEVQYKNFLQMSEGENVYGTGSCKIDLEKELNNEIKKRDILLLQNHFMKDQIQRMSLENEKFIHLVHPLFDCYDISKDVVANFESIKDVQYNLDNYDYLILQHLQKELRTIKNQQLEVQTAVNHIIGELNTDMKDLIREILTSFKQVKNDVEQTLNFQVSHLGTFERENTDLKKKLDDLNQLCDSLNKQLEESDCKLQYFERDNMTISAKYNELRDQASATVTMVEDAQTYREEFKNLAELLLSASDFNKYCTKFPSHLRTCAISKEAASNITSVLEITLQKYNSCLLDLENEVKNSKNQLSKKISEIEVCSQEKLLLSSKVTELSKQLANIDDRMKLSMADNSKLQMTNQTLKEQLYRAQHTTTDLNSSIETAEREKQKLKEILSKMEQELELMDSEKNKLVLQLNNYKMKDESMLKKTMAIEEDKIKLKEEIISHQQNLQAAYMKLEIQDQQILEDKAVLKELQKELTSLRNEIATKEEELNGSKCSLDNNILKISILENKLKEMIDDRLILERENGNLLRIKQSLNDDMNVLKRELLTAENFKTQQESVCQALESELKVLNEEKQKLADLLSQLHREKGEVCNRLTCINRKKEHLNVELMRLQQRFEQATEANRKLNSNLEELLKENEEKQRNNDKLQKEVSNLTKTLTTVKTERLNLEAKVKEWSCTLEETSIQKEKLLNEIKCQTLNQENMKHQICLLKKDLTTSVRSIISLKKLFSDDIINLENEFLQKVSNIKTLSEDNIKKFNAEKFQAQKLFEERLQNSLHHLEMEKDEKINKLCLELNKLSDLNTIMIQKYEHALKEAENEKQILLSQLQREKQELEEQYIDLKQNLSEYQDDIVKLKRENKKNQEESQNSMKTLKQELTNLNQHYCTSKDAWEDKRNNLELKIKHVVDERDSTSEELDELKTMYKIEQNKNSVTRSDLDALVAKHEEVEALNDDMKRDMIEMKKNLQEAMMEKDKYFEILTDQKECIKQLENQKLRLNTSVDNANSKMEKLASQVNAFDKENAMLKASVDELRKNSSELGNTKSQLEEEIRRLSCTLSDKQATENELRLRLNNENEEKERVSLQLINACKKVADLEAVNEKLRQELHHSHYHSQEKQHKWHEYEVSFQKQFDEQRVKEQKLEDKRHNLEICLADATQQIQELNMTLGTFEDRIRFLDDKGNSIEREKQRILEKYSTISNILRNIAGLQLDGSINIQKIGNKCSFANDLQDMSTIYLEPDQVNTGIRALMGYIMQIKQDKETLEERLGGIERDNFCMVEKQKCIEQKMNKLHHALRACQHEKTCIETKLAQKIVALKSLENVLKSKTDETKSLHQKLNSTEMFLKNALAEKDHFEEHLNQLREKLSSMEVISSTLQDTIKNLESKNAKLDLQRIAIDGDLNRAEAALRERDSNIASLSERSDKQIKQIAYLEQRCEELHLSLKKVQLQSEQQTSNEHILRSDLKDLQKNKSSLEYNLNCSEDRLKQLSKNITGSENERKVIMERLESAQNVIADLKRQTIQQKSQIDRFQQRISDLEMSKSDLESKIKLSKTPLNNSYRMNDLNDFGNLSNQPERTQDTIDNSQRAVPNRQQLHFGQVKPSDDSKLNVRDNQHSNSDKLIKIRKALSSSLRNVAGDPEMMKNERKRLDFTVHDYKNDCY